MFLPTLCGLTATCLTLGCPECSHVTASFAIPICICCPVPSNALSIYPDLALAHATHIQSQRLIPTGSLKVCLQSGNILRMQGANVARRKWCWHGNFFIPYTRPMAVGFGLTTILASIQLNLSLLGSSGSSVRLSGQPTTMEVSLPSFLTTIHSLMKVRDVKTYLIGPSLPGKISGTFIQPMKNNRTNNTSVPRLIMHSNILFEEKQKSE